MTQGDGLVLHFDAKMMQDLTGSKSIERLPIIVTQYGTEQLLGAPKLQSESGKSIAHAIVKVLKEWGLLNKIQAICFDTTAVNTGKHNGAAVILENILQRSLLYLPCRHHIFELILKEVYTKLLQSATVGPGVPIFQRFQQSWNSIDKNNFTPGIFDKDVAKHINNKEAYEIIEFCQNQLYSKQPRDDYKEFLELMILFLGGGISRDRKFSQPGPVHHARWMGKGIYSLKIFLFREQFHLLDREKNGLRNVCIFLSILYIKAWYTCKSAVHAPQNDLNFIKAAIDYATINKEVSDIVLKKISSHLWYLSDEVLGFSFFDSSVPIYMKRKMVEALKINNENKKRVEENAERIKQNYKSKELDNFVTVNTMKFFERFEISTEFLQVDPEDWAKCEDYKDGLDVCRNIQVVNDIAERAVQMVSKYNRTGTKAELDLQYMLQVIRDYNNKYPSANRSDLG